MIEMCYGHNENVIVKYYYAELIHASKHIIFNVQTN